MPETDVVIRAESLGKRYSLGALKRPPAPTLRQALSDAARALAPWRNGRHQTAKSEFWALNGVSFTAQRGDVVGVIGRNGAGKSTLLKILSQVTEPTSGRVTLDGRVASLLEVGTGFHPELTGRENVFLNGAILGMRRAEIRRKFDDIVAFAEVESFIDTPVKFYSSGMYVRLAFAVAAHLEPEILIIDEVLAVGDAAFQKKCLGKIGDVVHGGRTVLFVSHNMAAVSSLCNKVVLLERGNLVFEGPTRGGIERYTLNAAVSPSVDLSQAVARKGPGEHGRCGAVSLFSSSGVACDAFAMGDAMTVELEVDISKHLRQAEVGFTLDNALGSTIHVFVSTWEGLELDLAPGRHRFRATIPEVLVYPGIYTLSVWMKREGQPVDDQVEHAVSFTVVGADLTGHNPCFERYAGSKSEVYCKSRWSLVESPERNTQTVTGGTRD